MERYWKSLDKEQRKVLLLAALMPPPISLDVLIGISSISAIKILQLMDEGMSKGVLAIYNPLGKGYYYYKSTDTVQGVLGMVQPDDLKLSASKLIRFFENEYKDGPKKNLAIAHLYDTACIPVKKPHRVIKAGEYCLQLLLREDAAVYFNLVLQNLQDRKHDTPERRAFIHAVLGLMKAKGHLMPLRRQRNLLERALGSAERLKDLDLRARVSLVYARILKTEGEYEKAAGLFEEGWNLARDLGNDQLLKWAALSTTDFIFWKGQVAKAVERYEQVIGNLEELPSDEDTLIACATLGWCYGICGRTARGIGLIDGVRNRAEKLGLHEVKPYADLMSVLSLLEARRIPEAESYLKEIFSLPEDKLGRYILWAANAAKAYICYNHGDLAGCFEHLKKTHEHASKFGRFHHRGPWNFEYMGALERAGMVHPEMNYDSEMDRFLNWPDIYMRGVALRYKAKRELDRWGPQDKIFGELRKSERLLHEAGAMLERSRTQIVMARMLLADGRQDEAQELIEEAWKILSEVNEDIFPDDLRKHLKEMDRERLLLKTVVDVGTTIGTVRNQDELLQKIINLTMRLSRAERGGFFLLEDKGKLVLAASRNLDLSLVSDPSFRSNLDSLDEAVHSGKEIIKSGVSGRKISRPKGIRAGWVIISPVILQDETLGVLYLESSLVAVPFPKRDLPLLRAIGNHVAIALDNVRAYGEIAELRERLEQETRFYREEMESSTQLREFLGNSEAIRSVRGQIHKVAHTDSSVFITGETGVGKSLVAQAIHRLSRRAKGPFVPVNVGSFSQGVVASELFGHERGAFTGAVRRKLGRFELADGGTLFLDDVDNLSPHIQARILRVIQEKIFERVGGTNSVRSDFRIIAATNQNIDAMIKAGKFRSDLYYRLNVFPIHICPLRARKEDIPILAMHFLRIFNGKMGKKVKGISESQMKCLMENDWPGNVRELSHIIERAVILSESRFLKVPSLKRFSHNEGEIKQLVSLEEMEKGYIISVLEACNWKVSGRKGAAEVLKLNPSTLYSKIRRLGIQRKISYL